MQDIELKQAFCKYVYIVQQRITNLPSENPVQAPTQCSTLLIGPQPPMNERVVNTFLKYTHAFKLCRTTNFRYRRYVHPRKHVHPRKRITPGERTEITRTDLFRDIRPPLKEKC